MAKITFQDKESLITNGLPEKNKVTSDDVNEIKNSVNDLYDNPIATDLESVLSQGNSTGTQDLIIGNGTVLKSQSGLNHYDLENNSISGVLKLIDVGITAPVKNIAVDSNGNIVNGDALIPVITAGTKIRAIKSGNQSIPNSVDTVLIYDIEVYNTLSEYDPVTGKTTIKYSGYYHIHGQALSDLASWDVNESWILSIYVNKTLTTRGMRSTSSSMASLSLQSSVEADLYLTAGDIVDIRVLQNQGGAVDVSADSNNNQFSIHRIP